MVATHGLTDISVLMTAPFEASVATALSSTFGLIRHWRDEKCLAENDWHRVRALALCIETRVDDALLDRFPDLEIISTFGVGHDHIDLAAASRRGLVVTNTPGILDAEVADLALGLLLSTVRQIPQARDFLKAGEWGNAEFPHTLSLRERRVGIAGLGRIGREVARRLVPMVDSIGYAGRSRQDVPYTYYRDLSDLAEWSDILVCVLPGGPSTFHLVDAAVLRRLGPQGILINVGRGSVVDQRALVQALSSGEIFAAGLDVYEQEHDVPNELLACKRSVLLPHVGSSTVHTRQAMGQLLVRNLVNWFTYGEALTPIQTQEFS